MTRAAIVQASAPPGVKQTDISVRLPMTRAARGIIPAKIEHGRESLNDQPDLAYLYLEGKTSGVLTFAAPRNPGRYDLRMHDTDSGGGDGFCHL